MTKQLSYTKVQQEMQRSYRERLDRAESTEDVKKFFTNTMQELFDKVMEEESSEQGAEILYEDVSLTPDSEQSYYLSDSLMERGSFQQAWTDSDLPHIVNNFAQSAVNRYRRLEKNTARTRSKIRR